MFAMVKKDSQQEAVKIQENNFISEASHRQLCNLAGSHYRIIFLKFF